MPIKLITLLDVLNDIEAPFFMVSFPTRSLCPLNHLWADDIQIQ